jgi:hypothetical protein
MAVKAALVYTHFHPANDNSIFRFPTLGIGYIAAALKNHWIGVELFDCTFLWFSEAIERVKPANPRLQGFTLCFLLKKNHLRTRERA